MEELETIRQRLQALRLKAERVAKDLAAFEQDILRKIHQREEKKPPN